MVIAFKNRNNRRQYRKEELMNNNNYKINNIIINNNNFLDSQLIDLSDEAKERTTRTKFMYD